MTALRPEDYAATPSRVPEGFGAPLDAPPPPLLREDNGRLVVEWPHGRPRWFVMTPEALDELADRCNALVDDLALLEADAAEPPCPAPNTGGEHVWTTAGRCDRCDATSVTVPW